MEQASFPQDCFLEEEVRHFQTFENLRLNGVIYHLWRRPGGLPPFLFALELRFETGEILLLATGETRDVLILLPPEQLIKTAQTLTEMHGEAIIQTTPAHAQPIWQNAYGQILNGIRLSRHPEGLYYNDALLLDFDACQLLVQPADDEGLALRLA
jgi:hypothetical protein